MVSVPKAIEVTQPWDRALAHMASCGILGKLLGLCESQLSLHLLWFFHGMIVKVQREKEWASKSLRGQGKRPGAHSTWQSALTLSPEGSSSVPAWMP